MNQIIYPKYAFFISIYAIFLFVIGITYANNLDKLFEKLFGTFNSEKNKKGKIVLMFETILQVVFSVVGSYIIREIIEFTIRDLLNLKKHIYGNPDKFAVVILAPAMFFVQRNFRVKLLHLLGIKN